MGHPGFTVISDPEDGAEMASETLLTFNKMTSLTAQEDFTN